MLKSVCLTVNGEKTELYVDERESLTDMLRERLGLKSVKKGCEAGECGACTVLWDGRAVHSCIQLAVWADGHEIRTLESLNTGETLHPLQQAFLDQAAVQCGFCTPGLIMAGLELVESGKRYTRAQIKKHVEGHLCRCTGYENIINAIFSVVGKEETV